MTCKIWYPHPQAMAEADFLRRVEAMTFAGRAPLSEDSLEMLGAISRAILNHPEARKNPQYVALGYWLRPASLKSMAKQWHIPETEKPNAMLLPRGTALHLPPTNVDTIFAYSWALSVMAGNANIVRVADALQPATGWLVELIATILASYGESERQIFVNYPYGGAFDLRLSAYCDLRLIWGGDQKVAAVSKIPIRPDGLTIGFPDRKSLAVIKASSYAVADETMRDQVASQLYNDIYWFDQMGCGSPRILVWVGKAEDQSFDLINRLQRLIAVKKLQIETGVAINKMVHANGLLVEGLAQSVRFVQNELTVVRGDSVPALLDRSHGGGFFAEIELPHISSIAPIISRKVQTVTHFGFGREELLKLGQSLIGRGGYRLVPIGQALQFDEIWDGVDLFRHFTRQLIVRSG